MIALAPVRSGVRPAVVEEEVDAGGDVEVGEAEDVGVEGGAEAGLGVDGDEAQDQRAARRRRPRQVADGADVDEAAEQAGADAEAERVDGAAGRGRSDDGAREPCSEEEQEED